MNDEQQAHLAGLRVLVDRGVRIDPIDAARLQAANASSLVSLASVGKKFPHPIEIGCK